MPPFLLSRTTLLVSLIISAMLAGVAGVALINAGDDTGPTTGLPPAGPLPTLSPTPPRDAEPDTHAHRDRHRHAYRDGQPHRDGHGHGEAHGDQDGHCQADDAADLRLPEAHPHLRAAAGDHAHSRGAGEVGDTFSVTAVATDGDGEIYMNGLDFGDGTTVPAQTSPKKCKAYPPLHSPPGAYQAEPDKKDFGPYSHKYLARAPTRSRSGSRP